MECYIDTGDAQPVYCQPHIFHHDLQKRIYERLESMVQAGILREVQFSRWGAQVCPVNKPDGSIRVCGNYTPLNKVTIPLKYPYPNMHYILQSLGQAKIFSKLDLCQGFFKFRSKNQTKKTALVATNATYVFKSCQWEIKTVLPFFKL
jgi:hypothetical protein